METPTSQVEKTVRFTPPPQMFVANKLREKIMSDNIQQGQLTTPTYRVDTPEEGGILLYEVGSKYPVKGWAFREAVYAVDSIKRIIINAVRFASSKPFRYALVPLIFFPRSWKRKIARKAMEMFADYTIIVFDRWGRVLEFQDEKGNSFGLQGVVIEPNYYCDMVREFRRVGMEMAGDDAVNKQIVETICMVLEFDDAYRYRIQDLVAEINIESLFQNPSKEIARIMEIAINRGEGTKEKFETFLKVVPLLLKVKGIRELVLEFFSKVDLNKLKLDKIDMYRCLLWGGWQFGGMTDEQKLSQRLMLDTEFAINQIKPK